MDKLTAEKKRAANRVRAIAREIATLAYEAQDQLDRFVGGEQAYELDQAIQDIMTLADKSNHGGGTPAEYDLKDIARAIEESTYQEDEDGAEG